MPLHPRIADAAAGRLPAWAEATAERREHVARVAGLMGKWAGRLGLSPVDTARWRASGLLHDSLRDAAFETLRPLVGPELRDAPGKMLHGPAAAARLRQDGVDDEPLLLAIAWHTLGHPDFDPLGKALYLADYTEPGRAYESPGLAALRARVPEELDAALQEVAVARIGRSLQRRRPLLTPTVEFWNSILEG
ncbi:MAG: HD domain-containing protein [Gemmatimonadota bacterium]